MKRGPKPKRIIDEKWSAKLAYAVGLIATDGCLSTGHLIDLTSKDREQLENYVKCLGISNKIGRKDSGQGKTALRIQFRNVFFYKFLTSLGLSPAKSKTIGILKIPNKYFFDFLRGSFDGDGCSYSYWDPRWKSSFMFYLTFVSASEKHIFWLREKIFQLAKIKGHINMNGTRVCHQLKYAKYESIKLVRRMYYTNDNIYLSRKKLKIDKALAIMGKPSGKRMRGW